MSLKTPSFLALTAEAISDFPLESTLVILPTRRAAAELRKLIAASGNKAMRLPTIAGVSDFNERSGRLPVQSKEVLLLELFSVYSQHDQQEDFSSFSRWGEQLIKDFNEIDLQLIFANDLFRKVTELREIELEFSPEEERDNFLKFWNDLSGKSITPLRQQFLSYWEKLPFVYHDFRNHLMQKGFGYEGLSLRLAAESEILPYWLQRFTHVVYAGFYALNRVEEKFLEIIDSEKSLLILKDADQWYVNDINREAGMFFRKGFMSDNNLKSTGNYLQEIPKHYTVTGTTGSTTMAREIASRLAEQLSVHPGSAADTIVILPDENLLFSLLNFCKAFGVPVNPSMGFPFPQHPLWQVLETARKIRTSFPQENDPVVHIRKKEILEGCFLLQSLKDNAEYKSNNLQERLFRISTGNISDELSLLKELMLTAKKFVRGPATDASDLFIEEVLNAGASLLPYDFLETEHWWQLLTDILKTLRIPFRAGQDQGIHVMGFLESRTLDFEHVYIASMNEGTFPSSSVSSSLIPYVIRKYYSLPCREEQEAVTAYHFYRLLQRAGTLNFYYDNSPDAMGGGEKSRFLLQLYHELIPSQKNSSVRYTEIVNPPSAPKVQAIRIVKSEAIQKILESKYITGEKQKALSASAINTFIHCPLKFYLEQVAEIKSEDDAVKAIEANVLGQILHKAMEKLYAGKEEIDSSIISMARENTATAVSSSIAEIYHEGPLSGHDLLMQEVLKKLVDIILDNDETDAPFRIISTENEYRRELNTGKRTVRLKGYIDRLDVCKGVMRVLDYKTGQDEIRIPPDITKIYTDPAFKATLQLLLYLYLVQDIKNGYDVIAGIFRLSRESQFTFLKGTDTGILELTDFENKLSEIIDEIFDPEKAFEQTSDVKRCAYCDFAGLCRRN